MPKCGSIKLQSSFIEITLRHGCSPVNLVHIFRTPFPKNASRGLLLTIRYLDYFEFFMNFCEKLVNSSQNHK